MFLDELKQSISERKTQIDNVRTQVADLKEEKEKKQEEITTLKNEFAISLDTSIMDKIRTIETEIQGIDSQIATLQYAISSNTYKAKATGDIKQELTEYAAKVKLEKNKKDISNAIKELNRAVDAYKESVNSIMAIACSIAGIAEKVHEEDLSNVYEWFNSIDKDLSCAKEFQEFKDASIGNKLDGMVITPNSLMYALRDIHKNANR